VRGLGQNFAWTDMFMTRQNGLDNLGVSGNGNRLDMGDLHVNNPTEEVNLFLEENKNKHYGYPYCWYVGQSLQKF